MEKNVKCPACNWCFLAIVSSDEDSVTCPQCGQIIVAPLGANDQRERLRLQRQLRVLTIIALLLTVVASRSFCLPLPWLRDDRSDLRQFPLWAIELGTVLGVASFLLFFWIFSRIGEAQSVVWIAPLTQSRRMLVIGLWLLALAFAAYVFAMVTCQPI